MKPALAAGLLINVTADNVIRLLPPLVISSDEAEQLVNLLSLITDFLTRVPAGVPAASGLSGLGAIRVMELRHYLQFKDFSGEEYDYLFDRTRWIKEKFKNYEKYQPLVDRTLAMIFEKASTRTRVSFEAGMYQLGGSVCT